MAGGSANSGVSRPVRPFGRRSGVWVPRSRSLVARVVPCLLLPVQQTVRVCHVRLVRRRHFQAVRHASSCPRPCAPSSRSATGSLLRLQSGHPFQEILRRVSAIVARASAAIAISLPAFDSSIVATSMFTRCSRPVPSRSRCGTARWTRRPRHQSRRPHGQFEAFGVVVEPSLRLDGGLPRCAFEIC